MRYQGACERRTSTRSRRGRRPRGAGPAAAAGQGPPGQRGDDGGAGHRASGTRGWIPTAPARATACSRSTACWCGASATAAATAPSCWRPATCCGRGSSTATRRSGSRPPGACCPARGWPCSTTAGPSAWPASRASGPPWRAARMARARRLAAMMAIAQQPRLDERLWMLFWELADRHGRVHVGRRVPGPAADARGAEPPRGRAAAVGVGRADEAGRPGADRA